MLVQVVLLADGSRMRGRVDAELRKHGTDYQLTSCPP